MTEAVEPSRSVLDLSVGLPGSRHALPEARFITKAGTARHVRYADRPHSGRWSDMLHGIGTLGDLVTLEVETQRHSRHGDIECSALVTLHADVGDASVFVSWEDGWNWQIQAASDSSTAADLALDAICELIPKPPARDADAPDFAITYWMNHPMGGGIPRTRRLAKRPFADVADNYPADIRSQLQSLCDLTDAPIDGRLQLFHGPPGTGKTRFIESLASEWASWCDLHYIIDPDVMFREASYLNEVMFAGDDDRWRLVVVEDGDEFIDINSKDRIGHGISRLLNLADGFIGRTAKVMTLISTNVTHNHFHEAAVRDGRCGANIFFPPFSVDEANRWLADRSIPVDGELASIDGTAVAPIKSDKGITLAELYGIERRWQRSAADLPSSEFSGWHNHRRQFPAAHLSTLG